jgi:hypothetical protein
MAERITGKATATGKKRLRGAGHSGDLLPALFNHLPPFLENDA